MKKLITIIILGLILIQPVKAEEVYYSEYGDYEIITEYNEQTTDLIDIQTAPMYKYYKEVRKNGEYYIKNKNDEQYTYIDLEDYLKTEYTDWNLNIPEVEIEREIKEREIYRYSEIKKIKYIHLKDFMGENNQLKINEIIIKSNNIEIPFTLQCEYCSEEFLEKVTNGNLTNEESYILSNGYIIIDLEEYYSLSEIEIIVYMTDYGTGAKRIYVEMSREGEKDSNIYSYGEVVMFFTNNETDKYYDYALSLNQQSFRNPEWEEFQISYEPIEETRIRIVCIENEYSYRDTKYRYYKIENQYAEGYHQTAPDDFNIQDKDSKLDFLKIRSRDKVVIKSEIQITNYDQTIEEFVFENTTNELRIEGNINIKENGEYNIKYIFPFIEIEKIVVVNIPENIIIDKQEESEIIILSEEPKLKEELSVTPTLSKQIPKEEVLSMSKTKEVISTAKVIAKTEEEKNQKITFPPLEEKVSELPKIEKQQEINQLQQIKKPNFINKNSLVISIIIILLIGLYKYLKFNLQEKI